MASTIKIKRSTTASSVPAGGTLAVGELALNTADLKIYTSANGTHNILLSENALANTNSYIATMLPTANATAVFATKVYAAANTYVNNNFLHLTNGGAVSNNITLNKRSDLRFADTDSSHWVAFEAPATVTANVTWTLPAADGSAGYFLKTSGAGVLTWDNVPSGTFDIAADSGADVTFSTGSTLTFDGTANEVETTVSTDKITIGLPDDVTIGSDLTITSNTAVGEYLSLKTGASANAILDEDNMASNSATALVTQQSVKAYVDNELTSNDLDFQGDSGGALSVDLDSETFTIAGTVREIVTTGSGQTLTISLPDDVTIGKDLVVSQDLVVVGNTSITGDLIVDGDLTYLNVATINVEDTLMKLSANNIADTVDTGIYSKYMVGATTKYTGYFRDADASGVFKFFEELQDEPTTTVDISGTGYAIATIEAVIDGGTY